MLVVKGICACLRKLKINHTIPIITVFYARRDYPLEVGKDYWKSLFWTNSYFLGSVGVNTAEIVEECIKNQ